MRLIFKISTVIVLAIFGIASYAQDGSSDNPSLEDCRKAFYSEKPDYTTESLRLYLVGKDSDIVPDKNASLRVNNDVLIMRLGYSALRKITPPSVFFELTSYSAKPSKYEDNHKLTIFLDNQLLLSESMRMLNSIVIAERFSLEMKYPDFLKFTAAKKVKLQLGETEIDLKP